MTVTVGVLAEHGPGERRVAVTPDSAARLIAAGHAVVVESGAGSAAWFTDEAYAATGARTATRDEVLDGADVLACVGPWPADARLRTGQAVVGLLAPLRDPRAMQALAEAGVIAVSLDGLPRTLPRAQSMDALSSQANVAGYKAVLVAADHYDRFFPLLITAAGTAKPAEVLVLGAGVAGLSAIGTARRLGAVVRAYDVRPASRGEVESLGAQFVELASAVSAAGEGGYARALTDDERAAQQRELTEQIARHDVVITTAQVPGRRPPVLVTAEALAAMRPGSVVVDLGASALGGNVDGSRPDEVVRTAGGVTVVGAGSLPAAMPGAASASYARNLAALLMHLLTEDGLAYDPDDEIARGVVVTHGGRIVHGATARALAEVDTSTGSEGS